MTERTRHSKSRSASELQEISQLQQQKSAPRLSSDSRSHIAGSNRDYMIIPKLGQSSLGQATGISMKKLLAEEMSKEIESKRRSPNVIAKLMGLEGNPSPRHVHRQQKPLSDGCELKIASKDKQWHRKQHDCRLGKKSALEQEEFRDVYEDVEASHIVNRRCSSRWSPSSILTKPEMSFIQQKFTDAKRLSTDKSLQDSKELDDTLDLLDSNKELLLKYLQKPSPVFVKHSSQVDHLNSFGSHIAVLKPSYSAKYEGNAKAWKSDSDGLSNLVSSCHLKREDALLLAPHDRHGSYIYPSSPEIELEENETMIIPIRIVVLKPNLGKMQNAGVSSSSHPSHGYLPSFSKMKEFSSVGVAKTLTWRSKDAPCNEELPKMPMSKGAREIARDITRRMRVSCDEAMDPKSSGFRGYAGDESSYDAYGSDTDSELDKFKLFHQNSSWDKKWCSYTSPTLSESSVNKEAKKRLSERWKVTHRYQDVEIVGKGTTLGEMLAISDRESRSKHSNAAMNISGEGNLFGNNNGTATGDNPVGISSRDGWKNIVYGTSYKNRSIPPSMGGRSYKSSTCHEKLAGDKYLMDGETLRRGRSKVVKGNLSRIEINSSKDSKLLSKKHLPRRNLSVNEIKASAEANFEIKMEANIKELSGQQPMFQIEGENENFRSIVSDVLAIGDRGGTTFSSKSSESLPRQSFFIVDEDLSHANDQNDSTHQELHKGWLEQGSPSSHFLGTEPDSSESSKEADHPSPVSVLHVPFAEDTSSSSKSIERVRAELHDLRMQLQLLKMESGEYSEVSLIPLVEEVSELSPIVSGKNRVLEYEEWEVSYALDVLNNYGIEESNPGTSTKTHSPERPLDPGLFDDLEKKYSDITVGSRAERRLLFDTISSAISQASQQQYDLFPWVTPKLGISQITQQKDGIRDNVVKLINQDFLSWEASERVLDREMQWSDSKGEVDLVGSEIEKLLIDDLISDVICIY
ncbi:uncharacterized protein [Henckelia pumila]|uniref:uncharacterized protein n=1 Tax=Henckelia pumila TaxID=405737 RepID=UPI003C6E86D2